MPPDSARPRCASSRADFARWAAVVAVVEGVPWPTAVDAAEQGVAGSEGTVGGDWGGSKGIAQDIWPQRMEVDYVRVYQ